MRRDHAVESEQHSPVRSARASARRALEQAENPEARRELREVLQLLYAASEEDAARGRHDDR